jgi:SagB-type dehydrogenase family enzyme
MIAPRSGSDARRVLIPLPAPWSEGPRSLEEALHLRRSTREFTPDAITLREAGQLLWAALGLTLDGRRTVPSAGALYPIRAFLVAGGVSGLEPGLYQYHAERHALAPIAPEDCRAGLCAAALGQACVRAACLILILTGDYPRSAEKYGERALRYVYLEAGHAAQNVYLQAAALGLGTVAIGAFDDGEVSRMLRLSRAEHPLYLMPVGRTR